MRAIEIVLNIFGAIGLTDYFFDGEEVSLLWASLFFVSAVVCNLLQEIEKLKERK